MSTFTFRAITDLGATSGPDHEAAVAFDRLIREDAMSSLGHLDFISSVEQRALAFADQKYTKKLWFVILKDQDIVGAALLDLPIADNTHLAWVDVIAKDRRQDIYEYGLGIIDDVMRAEGRTVANAYFMHGLDPAQDHPGYLQAPTGFGAIDKTAPEVVALFANGWEFEQTERYSVLELPVPAEKLEQLNSRARAKAGAMYEVVSWQSHTPPELLEGHAKVMQAMSTDVPSAGLEIEETAYDAERIKDLEESLAKRQYGYLAVGAVHKETGELAGTTRVEYQHAKPQGLTQEETLVLAAHRGHSLGMLLKTELAKWIPEVLPQAARIHTWNAGENRFMLSINEALGFTKRGTEGAWQKKYVSE